MCWRSIRRCWLNWARLGVWLAVGLVISGLVYLLLSRSLDVAAEQSAIDASERELRAINLES